MAEGRDRAAYMREAEVLILDEPTAALDARAEFEVFQRFKELSKGKTAVLISHRFSSVRMADRIFVLADGKVEAAGTHEELVAQPGPLLRVVRAAGCRLPVASSDRATPVAFMSLSATGVRGPMRCQPAITGSPTICVRCMRRRRLSSKASRRCMTQRLSHITRSPIRHFWYQAKRSWVACAHTASSSFSLCSTLRPWM
jgi:ABC-type sulfate/molybdate transport systems ATPase subunit